MVLALAEDRESDFRPFYRTDEARDRESGGTGLGWQLLKPPFSSIVAGLKRKTARWAVYGW